MLISHEHQFVFVHVPKTGGDSISAALSGLSEVDGSTGRSKHWSARRIRETHFSDSEAWGDYFSFGVVRNPWEQVHSDYWFCRQSEVPSEAFGSWRDKVKRSKEISFSEFVTDICGMHGMAGPGLFGCYLADRNGRQMVTNVLRHENLAKEWSETCDWLGIPKVQLPRKNVTRDRPDYREDYDERSRFLVGRKFANDIQRFNYTFEGLA
jgi:hypothetical protein